MGVMEIVEKRMKYLFLIILIKTLTNNPTKMLTRVAPIMLIVMVLMAIMCNEVAMMNRKTLIIMIAMVIKHPPLEIKQQRTLETNHPSLYNLHPPLETNHPSLDNLHPPLDPIQTKLEMEPMAAILIRIKLLQTL